MNASNAEMLKLVRETVWSLVFSLMVPSPLQVVALNKRSKEAESAFLGIYKQLIEAPGESPTRITDVHLHKQQQQFNHHTHMFPVLNHPPPLPDCTLTFKDESQEISSPSNPDPRPSTSTSTRPRTMYI